MPMAGDLTAYSTGLSELRENSALSPTLILPMVCVLSVGLVYGLADVWAGAESPLALKWVAISLAVSARS